MNDDAADTLARLIARCVARFGARPALVDGDRRWTYAALDRDRRAAARAFIAAGVQPGDRVCLWAPNSAEWIIACLGLQSAGAVLVPINTRFKGGEAADIVRRSGARIAVTAGEFLGVDYPAALRAQRLPALERIVVLGAADAADDGWARFLAAGEAVDPALAEARAQAVGPDDLSDIMFTSGTTGQSKGVMLSHAQTVRTYTGWSQSVGLCADDRYLVPAPFFHSFGYKAGWLAGFIAGAAVYPLAVFEVDPVLALIQRERITCLPGPPTIFLSILAHPRRAAFDLSSLRLVATGAANVPVEMVRRLRTEMGIGVVLTGYGLTEASATVSMSRHDDDPEVIATTVGRPIAGVEVRCVDARGRSVAVGEPGEILVRGYNVMRGYLDDPAATAAAIDAEGFLHTGDVGVIDERGYLRITDRIKDMFIVGGFNCYPAEIENTLYRMPGIAQVAVIGVPDARMGEVGKAFIVRKAGADLAADDVVAWCRAEMANYKVPRHVEFVDALPLNASGKVLKHQLRAS